MSPLLSGYGNPGNAQTTRGRRFSLAHLHKQSWTNPLAIDDNGILTATAGPNATTITPTLVGAYVAAGVATLAHPRNVIVTVTHNSSIVACNGVVTGTDMYGKTITETWAVTATGTSKTDGTAKAFKTVTSVTIIAATDASANTIIVGTGDVLGLEMVNVITSPVKELEDGAAPTAGVLVAGSTSANVDEYGTYDPNSALDGAKDFVIWYIVDDIQYDVDS